MKITRTVHTYGLLSDEDEQEIEGTHASTVEVHVRHGSYPQYPTSTGFRICIPLEDVEEIKIWQDLSGRS